jgi:hypothetical protein
MVGGDSKTSPLPAVIAFSRLLRMPSPPPIVLLTSRFCCFKLAAALITAAGRMHSDVDFDA